MLQLGGRLPSVLVSASGCWRRSCLVTSGYHNEINQAVKTSKKAVQTSLEIFDFHRRRLSATMECCLHVSSNLTSLFQSWNMLFLVLAVWNLGVPSDCHNSTGIIFISNILPHFFREWCASLKKILPHSLSVRYFASALEKCHHHSVYLKKEALSPLCLSANFCSRVISSGRILCSTAQASRRAFSAFK